jgi:Zn-dependent protease
VLLNPNHFIERIIFFLPALLMAFVLHEMAHAYVAVAQGDQTPRIDGRLSPDPRRHIDPIGLLMILFVGLGYARPVSINPARLRGQYSRLFVALAGPAANLFLAAVASLVIKLMGSSLQSLPVYCSLTASPADVLRTELLYIYTLNLFLMLFNLVPIPPLDGFELIRTPLRRYNPKLRYQIEVNRNGIFFAFIIFGFIVPSYLNLPWSFFTLMEFVLAPLTQLFGVALSFPCG